MNITYFQVTGGRVIIAMAADRVGLTNVNFGGFKQFVTAVGIYAVANPL